MGKRRDSGSGTKPGEFETLAEQFLAMLQNERNASAHTVRAYRREVLDFAAYLRETLGDEAKIAAVDHLHIRAYLGLLYERNLSKAIKRGAGAGGDSFVVQVAGEGDHKTAESRGAGEYAEAAATSAPRGLSIWKRSTAC